MSKELKMARFWLVWNPHGRVPTYRHDSRASADTEAARLAGRNPGMVFFVLKMVGGKAATVNSPADATARILAALQPDIDARQADLAKAWQPIETAPRGVEVGGNNAVSWMVLAWPDGEGGYHRQSGMMVGEKFYAAPAFYIGGRHGVKHYALREIEIFPTHWMPDPPPPADLAAKIGGE